MKIRYVHAREPGRVKVYDTERSLMGCSGFIHAMSGNLSLQEEYDKRELEKFEEDLKKGIILSYEIMEENAK